MPLHAIGKKKMVDSKATITCPKSSDIPSANSLNLSSDSMAFSMKLCLETAKADEPYGERHVASQNDKGHCRIKSSCLPNIYT